MRLRHPVAVDHLGRHHAAGLGKEGRPLAAHRLAAARARQAQRTFDAAADQGGDHIPVGHLDAGERIVVAVFALVGGAERRHHRRFVAGVDLPVGQIHAYLVALADMVHRGATLQPHGHRRIAGLYPACLGQDAEFQLGEHRRHRRLRVAVEAHHAGEPEIELLLGHHQPQRRTHAGAARDDHARDLERAGEAAGMQRTRTAEGDQRIAPRIAPALDRDDAHRALHSGIGHRMDAPGRLFEIKAERGADLAQDRRPRRLLLQAHRPAVEIARVQIAEHQIGIGDGGLAAAACIADRPRLGPGTVRPDRDQAHFGARDAAAAGADLEQFDRHDVERPAAAAAVVHRIDLEGGTHRRHPVVDRPELGGGAAHVEAHYMACPFFLPHLRAHQHPGRRAGFDDADRIGTGKDAGHQPAIGLHDRQPGRHLEPAQRRLQRGEIALDQRRHIGIGDRGAGALVFAVFRRDHARQCHADPRSVLRQDLAHAPLMAAIGIGVQEHHGHRLVAALGHQPRHRHRLGLVERGDHRPIRPASLADLEDIGAAHQRAGLFQVQVVGVVALATAHQQHVAKAACGDQRGAAALALQDRIGGDGGGMQHAADLAPVPAGLRQMRRQAVHRGARRGAGAGGHLPDMHLPVRRVAQHEIGEGAADVEGDLQHLIPQIRPGVALLSIRCTIFHAGNASGRGKNLTSPRPGRGRRDGSRHAPTALPAGYRPSPPLLRGRALAGGHDVLRSTCWPRCPRAASRASVRCSRHFR